MTKKIVFVLALGVQFATAMGVSKVNTVPQCYPCDATAAVVSTVPQCYPCDATEVKIAETVPQCYPCDASV
jgi:hypothetical protein